MAKGNVLDKAGLQTTGYIDKKGTPVTMGAQIGYIFNRLPPGMNIMNQDVCDIRDEPMKELVSTAGYPGDGWTGSGGGSAQSPEPNVSPGGTVKGGGDGKY